MYVAHDGSTKLVRRHRQHQHATRTVWRPHRDCARVSIFGELSGTSIPNNLYEYTYVRGRSSLFWRFSSALSRSEEVDDHDHDDCLQPLCSCNIVAALVAAEAAAAERQQQQTIGCVRLSAILHNKSHPSFSQRRNESSINPLIVVVTHNNWY